MTWKRILVPHDFSSPANHACALARDEAKGHGGKILLLHVIELPAQLTQDTAIIPDQTGARLEKDGVKPAVFIRFGKPAEEILAFADENAVELIVMGTHGRTGLAHL